VFTKNNKNTHTKETKQKVNYIHGGFTFLNSLSPVKDKSYKLCVSRIKYCFNL